MKLRNHPMLLTRYGKSIWPPLWTTTNRDRHDKPSGEIGVLKKVLMHEKFDTKCFLIIEHAGNQYMGTLTFSKTAFRKRICGLLAEMTGLSLSDISETDVS